MIKSTVSKVMWVGRATVFLVGLCVMLALVLGVASAAFAGNLDPLKLGSARNVATKITTLVGKVATGSALVVKNPSGGPALGLQANAGQAPLTVNADAGTATGLSADELDGEDSAAYQRRVGEGCAEGSSIRTIDVEGRPTCEPDDDGTVQADALRRELGTTDARTNETSDPVSFSKVKDVPPGILSRDAATLDGKDSADFAGAAHSHSGSDITSGTVAADRIQDGTGSGLDADQLDGMNSSEFATKVSEGWHEAPTDSLFINMGGPFNTAGYYKDTLGIVHLKGVVLWYAPGGSVGPSGCAGGQYTTFFTLPAGYRPAAREIHPGLKNNTPTRIDIFSDGRVAFCDSRNVLHGDWFSLDGISFRAAN